MARKVGTAVRKKQFPEPLGFCLKEEREEVFCIMVADGLPAVLAFQKAFHKDATASHTTLFTLLRRPHIRDRISSILRERAKTPGITLGEVTDMLRRVFAGSMAAGEFTAAHNAAFSLAKLYGLVVDRAQLDVVRRPSREPDVPSEVALGTWLQQLPSAQPGSRHQTGHKTAKPLISLDRHSLATGLAGETIEATASGSDLDGSIRSCSTPEPARPFRTGGRAASDLVEATDSGSDLDESHGPPRVHQGWGGIGNGASSRRVTGTPCRGAHSAPVAPLSKTGSPFGDEGTGIPGVELAEPPAEASQKPEQPPISAEDLF